jgi:hypothetical protein
LTDAAEWRLREGELFELRSDEAAAVGAFSLDYAGLRVLTRILFGPSSWDSTMLMASTAALVPEQTALFGDVMRLATEPTLMMLPPSPRYFTAACVTRRRPSTFMLKCR